MLEVLVIYRPLSIVILLYTTAHILLYSLATHSEQVSLGHLLIHGDDGCPWAHEP